MVLNHQFSYVDALRSQLTVVIYPVQSLVDKPIKFIRWVETNFTSQQEVLEENAQLRARQLLLQAKLQRLLALERENLQLRELMSSSVHLSGRALVAQILDAALDPMNQEVILDKGQADGVFVGQSVLDAYGVMGQVIEVSPKTSRVLLITDGRSAIPVQNNRNGMRSILAGRGYANHLTLLNIPDTADIAVGDFFVTSGLGGRFPFGYPVGRVVSVKKTASDRFAIINVKPSAHVDQAQLVVLVWPPSTTEIQAKNPSSPTTSSTKTKTSKSAANSHNKTVARLVTQ